ncbi:hypothetical protein GALMADRAFT_140817 [Galerina marginata CBS 339.88]|uniref:Uncharacterized protein n=1 Tax=Galerina marginata (strain CBS 339.88) TaxID=685588 RepID=A0A067SYY2_GALM3|nr:hypothetical protein GALMADRAFT_140817 [Galerina marginata CBS 339.88]
MSDILSNFSCLDELTQVIYQSIFKFAVLSTVSDDKWNIYIGLSGPQGRWWRGFWAEEDIHRIFVCLLHMQGSKSSDKLLESFAEKLAEAFIQGEMCISDWDPEKGAKIKFTLGPTSKKPIHVLLLEMSPEDAAAHATKVFIEIALQAQSRKCRLYPSSTDYQTLPGTTSSNLQGSHKSVPSDRQELELQLRTNAEAENEAGTSSVARKEFVDIKTAQEEIKSLKSQLKNVKRIGSPAEKPTAPAARSHKGASLANPNKKARKYQAIEFESDDE